MPLAQLCWGCKSAASTDTGSESNTAQCWDCRCMKSADKQPHHAVCELESGVGCWTASGHHFGFHCACDREPKPA